MKNLKSVLTHLVQMPMMPPGTIAPVSQASLQSLSNDGGDLQLLSLKKLDTSILKTNLPREIFESSTPPIHPAAMVVKGMVKYANLEYFSC